MIKQILVSFGFSAVLLLIFHLINEPILNGWLHVYFPILVYFFFFQSVMVIWLGDLARKDNWQSATPIMTGLAIRFLLTLLGATVLIVSKPAEIKSLLLQYILLYFGFLIFELFAVLPNLRRN